MKLQIFGIEELFDPRNVISNPEPLDSKGKFTNDGVYSEAIFGQINNSAAYSYSCHCYRPGECGIAGKFYADENNPVICPECNTPVIQRANLMQQLGWIDLGKFNIINPYFYIQICKAVGETNLKRMITYEQKLTIDGNEAGEEMELFIGGTDDNPDSRKAIKSSNLEEESVAEKKKSKWHEMGALYIYKHLFEMLDDITPEPKKHIVELLRKHKDIIFMSKLPVITSKLRPAMVNGTEIRYDKINNSYSRIINLSNYLKAFTNAEQTPLNINPMIQTLQYQYNEVFDKELEALSGKGGWFRNNFLANNLNFSSRSVIIPLEAKYAIDEIHLPYWTGLELFKYHILRELVAKYGYNFSHANTRHRKAYDAIDIEILNIMQGLLDKSKYETTDGKTRRGYHMLINRNPTINKGSIILVRLTKIKTDITDLTMSISNNILPPLAGDYDKL